MQYRVLEKSYINDAIQEAGAIVELPDGVEPGPNVELIGDPLDHDGDGKKGGAKALPAEPATADEIKAAVAQLDVANDEHWTGGGKPSVDAVVALLNGKTANRAAIEQATPETKRVPPVA